MLDINLRNVVDNDETLLFKWRNIDELVELSYYKKKVTLDEHKQWFISKIINPDCELHVVQLNRKKNIGLIRMELVHNKCEISVYLIPGNERKGYGYKALIQAFNRSNLKCPSYIAKIQLKNIPSQKLFKKLEFIEVFKDNTFVIYQRLCFSK